MHLVFHTVRMFSIAAVAMALASHQSMHAQEDGTSSTAPDKQHSHELKAPVRLLADGKPIDIGALSRIAHAGPCVADVDNDGDRDLLVGDFPGYFWYFENVGTDQAPSYESKGKLQAGGEDAKTPVY